MTKKTLLFILLLLNFNHLAASEIEIFTLQRNYFTMGDHTDHIKAELGFIHRMLNNKPLFFGYHQKTLWDTNTKSSPVLDTNYNPHIFYGLGMYKNWNWTLGILEHLSNGRTEQESRGLNMSYLQAMRSYQFERIEIDLGVKVFKSYKVDNGSPDLDEYTGTWALFLRVKNFINLIDKEHFLETRLSSGGKWGEDISKGNLELSMHLRATDASPLYFYVQYFTGRNEYLLDYKKYSDSAHIGLSFQI